MGPGPSIGGAHGPMGLWIPMNMRFGKQDQKMTAGQVDTQGSKTHALGNVSDKLDPEKLTLRGPETVLWKTFLEKLISDNE